MLSVDKRISIAHGKKNPETSVYLTIYGPHGVCAFNGLLINVQSDSHYKGISLPAHFGQGACPTPLLNAKAIIFGNLPYIIVLFFNNYPKYNKVYVSGSG